MLRQIYLFSCVDSYTAKDIIQQLLTFDREGNDEITMYINSPGGSVTSMFSIIDIMRAIKSDIRTVVVGTAASAAAVIAACGDTRLITKNSQIMVHEVWTVMGGSMSDLDETVVRMSQEQNKLLMILSEACGKSVDEIKALIKKNDKYFSAQEAISFGIADTIVEDGAAQILKLSEGVNCEGYEIAVNDKGLSEVQLLKEGTYLHPVHGTLNITGEAIKKMVENFDAKVRGIDISIDYTHENEGGESPAAFWIKKLEVKDGRDGKALFARGEFTPKGKKLVAEKEYKYASADFAIDYVSQGGAHFPFVLRGGTLTNRPFIKEMNPIKLSEPRKTKEHEKMEKEALLAMLKEQHGVDVISMEASTSNLKKEIETLQNQFKDLAKIPVEKDGEIENLKKEVIRMTSEMTAKEKSDVVKALIVEGKVLPVQEEKVLGLFKNASEIVEFYKDAPKVVSTEKKGDSGAGDETLTDAEKEVVAKKLVTPEDVKKYRTVKK